MTISGDVLIWTVTGLVVGAALGPATVHSAHRRTARHLLLPVAAAMTAALFAVLAWRTPARAELIAFSALAALAVPLAIIDAREQRLPLPLIHSAYAAVITPLTTTALLDGNVTDALRATSGMTTSLLFYLTIALTSPGGLGAGDVRLAGITGWALAWKSWETLALGTAVFALTTLAMLIALRQRTHIPAGPTMLLGTFIALLT
jgi:leader peptidase (prepilin peptidase) / N-methyltransferase